MDTVNFKKMEHKQKIDTGYLYFENDLKSQKLQREKTDQEKSLDNKEEVTQMTSSIASILDDTPSDSGIQMLSSMTSSMLSSAGFEYDSVEKNDHTTITETNNNSHDDGQSTNLEPNSEDNNKIPEELMTSITSTFDTENTEIVYRRKIKKNNSRQTPKKRVSFHEDILKNTKTDNIHIEHGFITYKQQSKSGIIPHHKNGRYSWCSEFDQENYISNDSENGYDNNEETGGGGSKLYRNACSDVLDYGRYEENNVSDGIKIKSNAAASNVLEYGKKATTDKKGEFYTCNCSSSNSSLESSGSSGAGSEENNGNTNNNKSVNAGMVEPNGDNKRNYQQAKSNSCDCIGENNNNNNISSSCYYSEPNIKHLNDDDKINENKLLDSQPNGQTKPPISVWSKEKKPKSSCLKKTKRNSTYIIPEYDLNTTVKKFNVHQLADVNNLIVDNSKMIIGSLKDIFGMSIPERGVPEGSEDQTVTECCPPDDEEEVEGDANDNFTIINKPRPFLSKSLDGGFHKNNESTKKNYIHNVDEQLRRTNEADLYAKTPHPSRQNSVREISDAKEQQQDKPQPPSNDSSVNTQKYRNKFIINCESIVFEHTGVSYFYEKADEYRQSQINDSKQMEQFPGIDSSSSSAGRTPFSRKLSNMFKTFKTDKSNNGQATPKPAPVSEEKRVAPVGKSDSKESNLNAAAADANPMESSMTSSSSDKNSVYSDLTATTSNSATTTTSATTSSKTQDLDKRLDYLAKIYGGKTVEPSPKIRHLSSPIRKKLQTTPTKPRGRMSPDLFAGGLFESMSSKTGTNSVLSEEFDDILTIITTETDRTESNNDMVIVDYPDKNEQPQQPQYQYLKPPTAMTTSTSSKTSLINRFLRTVTQKKIFEANIKKNTNQFVQSKLSNDRKLFENLYVKSVNKPMQQQLISDLNAEIAMEIELAQPASAGSSPLHTAKLSTSKPSVTSTFQSVASAQPAGTLTDRFEGGLGEVSIELFNVDALHILRNKTEILMKAFKLYTGYSREGHMTPVLVLLTDKTLYVADLVRNRLCNKFVLPYIELDVILMGLFGNTVLLSNSARDMQQVLLAGGPYPADCLVASLELCARRGGSQLPAVGQLTLDHLAPLQAFVRDHSSVDKEDTWKYYSVVNIPSSTLGAAEQEPLGPHLKGPLMHRNLASTNGSDHWSAGYFLLKAGVLYLFSDSTQKIPTWAVTLAECQGARRSAANVGRPHCFELLLRTGSLQLAAPDDDAASEWLQALVQAASGLFEMQEKHKTLGCSLIMTSNHLITLREDFASPLRRVNTSNQNSLILSPPKGQQLLQQQQQSQKENVDPNVTMSHKVATSSNLDTSSEISSIRSSASTPTRVYDRRSNITSPTKLISGGAVNQQKPSYTAQLLMDDKSHTNMTSFYGKNSGLEILTCATIEQMINVKIASDSNQWWCILEFSCQEVCESSDDLVIFFSTKSEQSRFLALLEILWNDRTHAEFPVSVISSDNDIVGEHCANLFTDINRSWEPLMTAALGYPQ